MEPYLNELASYWRNEQGSDVAILLSLTKTPFYPEQKDREIDQAVQRAFRPASDNAVFVVQMLLRARRELHFKNYMEAYEYQEKAYV